MRHVGARVCNALGQNPNCVTAKTAQIQEHMHTYVRQYVRTCMHACMHHDMVGTYGISWMTCITVHHDMSHNIGLFAWVCAICAPVLLLRVAPHYRIAMIF